MINIIQAMDLSIFIAKYLNPCFSQGKLKLQRLEGYYFTIYLVL